MTSPHHDHPDDPGPGRGPDLGPDLGADLGPEHDRLLDDALHELTRWVADTQVDDAIELRRRSAWMRRQADEETTLVGVLVALAEQGRPVTLHVGTGRRHRGLIVTVGRDVVELRSSVGQQVIVALEALESVRPQADVGAVSAGAVATGATLAEVIGRLAEQRERVLVVTRSGEATTGELTAVGRDVLTLALDAGGVAYLSLAALAEVSGPESG